MLIVVGIGSLLQGALGISPPTAVSLNPDNLAPLAMPMPASPIAPTTSPSDAGDLYRRAIDDYPDQHQACEDFSQNPTGVRPEAMQLILDAAGKSSANIFAGDPGRIVNYQSDHADLDALEDLGNDVVKTGLLLRINQKPEDARVYFQASFALGQNLYRERLVFDEYRVGIEFMDESLGALAEGESANPTRAEEFQNLQTAIVNYDKDHVRPLYQMLSSADPNVIAANAGDVFVFATRSQERMFRVEAILKLGRYRFDADRNGDQRGADRYLKILASDADPVIRTAAEAGKNLTIEEYRTIH